MCTSRDCEIAPGRCHCGCGQPAPLAKKTATKYGHVKGEPVRYINGHYQRSTRLSSADHVVDEATGCWLWQRYVTPSGYGHLRGGGRMQYARGDTIAARRKAQTYCIKRALRVLR